MNTLSGLQARALIDCDALLHNVHRSREMSPNSKILAVVKADAYGHTIDIVSRVLEGNVDGFAVTTIEEAIRCRDNGVNSPIVVLSAFSRANHLESIQSYELIPVIYNQVQLHWIETSLHSEIDVWLKVDTGMNRLGIHPNELSEYVARLDQIVGVKSLTFISHLADADDIHDDFTSIQIEKFVSVTEPYDNPKSMANSAGVINWPISHFEWNRPGLLIYGGSAVNDQSIDDLGLKPVMHLSAIITSVKYIPKGAQIGYGGSFVTKNEMRVGVVGFGYGDGYPRTINDEAYVMIKGKKSPIIGKISMDMMTVDLSEFPETQIGDEVILWGHGLSVDTVAKWANTIPYELLCKVTSRVPRVAINGTV